MSITFQETIERMKPLMDKLNSSEKRKWDRYKEAPQNVCVRFL